MLTGVLAIEIESANSAQLKMFASIDTFLLYGLPVGFSSYPISILMFAYILHVYNYMNTMYVTL